ncbi:protein adenylyltransferase SelO [Clostridium sp. DL1XJH146]
MIKKKEASITGFNFNNSYASLPKSFFSIINLFPVSSPKLIIFNDTLASSLSLNSEILKSYDGVEILSGNQLPKGALPIAQAYGGHQFGHFTILGDGRALLLGEHITPKGKRFDIQLKGSGRTPYSRMGDGRATLGPMLREYIISEAMYGLDIPTTRSLAVVTTGESIYRESLLPGAILTRVAESHLRVGTFEYASHQGTIDELRALANYALQRHFPEVKNDKNPYLSLLKEVIKRQANLIAKWQLVGFIHGVMNTDNMTISGETIDYGPCAFMDKYDPQTVFSSIDTFGRYAYGNQPSIGAWNLARFAETLLPLLHNDKKQAINLAEDAISQFTELYSCNYINGMRAKLGIFNEEPQDEPLIEELLSIMKKYNGDYTNTFRALTFDNLYNTPLFDSTEFHNWNKLRQARLDRQQNSRNSCRELMMKSNPSVIPRNHHVEEALEAAVGKGDYSVMKKLLAVLSNPYAYTEEHDEYTAPAPPSSTPYRTFCGT